VIVAFMCELMDFIAYEQWRGNMFFLVVGDFGPVQEVDPDHLRFQATEEEGFWILMVNCILEALEGGGERGWGEVRGEGGEREVGGKGAVGKERRGMKGGVIAIFASPLLSCTKGLFLFPYTDLSSLFDESRAKNTYFSTYTHTIYYTSCVYVGCSNTARVHQDLCQKIQK
jgi:hypothetical protein